MIDIGINFLHENKDCYNVLKKYNIINTLKFPGRLCRFEDLEEYLVFTKQNGFKIDLHGLPGMKSALACNTSVVTGQIDWDMLEKYFSINSEVSRMSMHIGIGMSEKLTDYDEQQLINNMNDNYNILKNRLKNLFRRDITLGVENIPGGFSYDPGTLTPEYVSNNWELTDFGVFDISHAKLAADTLNMSYDEYLEKLENIEKVNIIHSTGNMRIREDTRHIPDKHVLISVEEISSAINTINKFKNVDLVISEYTDNTIYSSIKETIIEAVVLNKIVKTRDEEKCINVFNYLCENLNDDISNVEEILETINNEY